MDKDKKIRWKIITDLKAILTKLTLDELGEVADVVEAIIFKKTTQRSPEWFGGANC